MTTLIVQFQLKQIIFWRAYKHENGNTYCYKEYVTNPD